MFVLSEIHKTVGFFCCYFCQRAKSGDLGRRADSQIQNIVILQRHTDAHFNRSASKKKLVSSVKSGNLRIKLWGCEEKLRHCSRAETQILRKCSVVFYFTRSLTSILRLCWLVKNYSEAKVFLVAVFFLFFLALSKMRVWY